MKEQNNRKQEEKKQKKAGSEERGLHNKISKFKNDIRSV